MDDTISVQGNHFCLNHNRIQTEVDSLRDHLIELQLKVQTLENSKAERDEISSVQQEISSVKQHLSTLSTQITSIKDEQERDRIEDREFKRQLRDDFRCMSTDLREYALNNEGVKVGQEYIITAINELKDDMSLVKRNTTFNWLEMLNSFVNDNWFRKILSWVTLLFMALTIFSSFIWLTTGQYLFPYIYELYINWFNK
jgi:signal transduction histidine kinase